MAIPLCDEGESLAGHIQLCWELLVGLHVLMNLHFQPSFP